MSWTCCGVDLADNQACGCGQRRDHITVHPDASCHVRLTLPARPRPGPAWLDVVVLRHDGAPAAGLEYEVELPDSQTRRGTLDGAGRLRLEGVVEGRCAVSFCGLPPVAVAPGVASDGPLQLIAADGPLAELTCATGLQHTLVLPQALLPPPVPSPVSWERPALTLAVVDAPEGPLAPFAPFVVEARPEPAAGRFAWSLGEGLRLLGPAGGSRVTVQPVRPGAEARLRCAFTADDNGLLAHAELVRPVAPLTLALEGQDGLAPPAVVDALTRLRLRARLRPELPAGVEGTFVWSADAPRRVELAEAGVEAEVRPVAGGALEVRCAFRGPHGVEITGAWQVKVEEGLRAVRIVEGDDDKDATPLEEDLTFIRQYLNLPRQARFLDGGKPWATGKEPVDRIRSVDRLGRVVRVALAYAGRGERTLEVELGPVTLGSGHRNIAQEDGRYPCGLSAARPFGDLDATFYDVGTISFDPDGRATAWVTLPVMGGNGYVLRLRDPDRAWVQAALPIKTMRRFYYGRLVMRRPDGSSVPAGKIDVAGALKEASIEVVDLGEVDIEHRTNLTAATYFDYYPSVKAGWDRLEKQGVDGYVFAAVFVDNLAEPIDNAVEYSIQIPAGASKVPIAGWTSPTFKGFEGFQGFEGIPIHGARLAVGATVWSGRDDLPHGAVWTVAPNKAGDPHLSGELTVAPHVETRVVTFQAHVRTAQPSAGFQAVSPLVFVATSERTSGYDDAAQTIIFLHEFGHFLGMVPRTGRWFYTARGHQGPHCSAGVQVARADRAKDAPYDTNDNIDAKCVMWGVKSSADRFCPACLLSLRRAAGLRLDQPFTDGVLTATAWVWPGVAKFGQGLVRAVGL